MVETQHLKQNKMKICLLVIVVIVIVISTVGMYQFVLPQMPPAMSDPASTGWSIMSLYKNIKFVM
jgi:hypothetical protein